MKDLKDCFFNSDLHEDMILSLLFLGNVQMAIDNQEELSTCSLPQLEACIQCRSNHVWYVYGKSRNITFSNNLAFNRHWISWDVRNGDSVVANRQKLTRSTIYQALESSIGDFLDNWDIEREFIQKISVGSLHRSFDQSNWVIFTKIMYL